MQSHRLFPSRLSPLAVSLRPVVLSAVLLAAPAAFAASYVWDGDGDPTLGTPAQTTAGSGTWSTTAANWNLNGSAATDVVWPSGSNSATFAGESGVYTITLGTSAMSVDNINFSSNGYSLSAPVATTLTSAAPTSTSTSNIVVAQDVTATLGSNVTYQAGAGGSLNLSGAGTLIVASGAKVQTTGTGVTLFVGSNSATTGSPTPTTVEIKSGGTLSAAGALGANAALKVTGGSVTVGSSSVLAIGNFTGTSTIANLTIDSGTVTAGTFASTSTSGLRFGANAAGSTNHGGVLNLNGGVLITSRIFEASGVGASSTVNFNGGTLRAIVTNNSDFLSSNLDSAVVKAGGAVIDTNTFNVTAAESLTHDAAVEIDGGLTKLGAGTLTLATATVNNYTGATTVSEGTLLAAGSLTATSSVSVNGGTLQLGSANRVNDAATVTISSGTVQTGGFAETVGAFNLAGTATIDLGAGASVFRLADSSAQTWNGTLSITNWSGSLNGGGTDQLIFGSSGFGLTSAQLALVNFIDPAGFAPGTYGASILPSGEIVAVPEPASAGLLISGVAFLLGRRRMRRDSHK